MSASDARLRRTDECAGCERGGKIMDFIEILRDTISFSVSCNFNVAVVGDGQK